jgi:hypothetical protein
MSTTRGFGALCAAAVAAAVLPMGITSAARVSDSQCPAEISVPNVSITQSSPGMFDWVQGHLARACDASDAKWDAYYDPPSGGAQKVGAWDFPQVSTASWGFALGSGPLGSYTARPAGAADADGNPVAQAATHFAIKLGSRVYLGGYRSGSYVYVHAHVLRFNWSLTGGYGAWQRSAGRTVSFYDRRSGEWFYDSSLTTGPHGWTGYLRIYAPSQRSFGAHVLQTATVWDARPASNIDR